LMNSNMYMLISGKRALVIDPLDDDEALGIIKKNGIKDITVILTHEHYDHISGVNALRALMKENGGRCTVHASRQCAEFAKSADTNLSRFFSALFITHSEEEQKMAGEIFDMDYSCDADILHEGDAQIVWERLKLKLCSTPGHSPGSICIEICDEDDILIALATGDSLVEGNTVITRLPNGSKSDYRKITRPYLEGFSGDTLVLPGHGKVSYMKDLVLG
ncbi:MAG: MBL fold metallo-hydrolase, partial [Lachnospiraceae bacterium]|nr:MBL fold metallo-hydrolase [Lachnospiraceae bacterium]